jgi:hypothetical protein
MNYEQVETDIVERLQGLMPNGVQVIKLPESEEDLQGLPFQNARVTVCYKGSDYGDGMRGSNLLRSTGQTVKQEILQVEVVIQSRFLRTGNDSAHKLLALVKRSLVGFQPENCDRMYIHKQIMLPDEREIADIYTFVQSFECTSMVVEEFDSTSEDIGLFSQITVNDEQNGDIQIP